MPNKAISTLAKIHRNRNKDGTVKNYDINYNEPSGGDIAGPIGPLTKSQKKYYKWVIKSLPEVGLQQADTITVMCVAIAFDMFINEGDRSSTTINFLYRSLDSLGMTPVSRAKLTKAPAKDKNPWESVDVTKGKIKKIS